MGEGAGTTALDTLKEVGLGNNWDIADPRAEALMESLRGFGYSPETAIADIVDNSISAGAKHIDVDFDWNGSNSTVSITDDGCGMTESTLINAMRLGSQNPLEVRAATDLGRFGLGMKTATFSQARELTVATKTAQTPTQIRRWDLDVVAQTGEWRLMRSAPRGSNISAPTPQGTAVRWSKLDRLVGEATSADPAAQDRFLRALARVESHLAATFHLFIEGRGAITIRVNGRSISPWDPFAIAHPATQQLGTEELPFEGETVRVTPYVLPHRSKFNDDAEADLSAGASGWTQQQGFYVYRSKRLVVQGDWLGLGIGRDEHTKLARIAIEFPASLDHAWQIDVKKSSARPPAALTEPLRRIAKATRSRAEDVYRHRGKVVGRRRSQPFVFSWLQTQKHGKVRYSINREHPVVHALFSTVGKSTTDRRAIERTLRFIEETVPTTLIGTAISSALDSQAEPFAESKREIRPLVDFLYKSLIMDGLSPGEAIDRIAASDPFSRFPEVVQTLREEQQC